MSLDGMSIASASDPLSAAQRSGATVVASFALLSTLALAFIALRTIRLVIVVLLQRDDSASRPPEILFFRTQLGYCAGCLILSNMFVSSAGLIDFSWVSHSGSSHGSGCSVQAVLMQIGIWATCWFTSVLGIHTVILFVLRIHPARWRTLAAVTIGWVIALIAGLTPLRKSTVYDSIGLSCGTGYSYGKYTYILEALPIILAALVSIVVYLVAFLALRGKLRLDSLQISRGADSSGREDRYEDHGPIGAIICAMFWFPLAFVLLALPLCITHILIYAGVSISLSPNVFADTCISLLGFVNVCLLYNTFRFIRPTSRRPRADKGSVDTVMTFGNDASGESPIVPSRYTISSHDAVIQLGNPRQASSNHSRNSSWASVDSNTELLCSEDASRKSVRSEVVPVAPSNNVPAWLGRRVATSLDPGPRVSSVMRDTESGLPSFHPMATTLDSVSSVMRDTELGLPSFHPMVTTLDPDSRVPSVIGNTEPELRSFHPMADSGTFTSGTKELTFRSKAPPALDLSHLSYPTLPLDVTKKSAARLALPVASAAALSQTPAIVSAQQLDQGSANASVLHATTIPRIDVWSPRPEHVDESQLSSPSSYTGTDGGSEYSGEILHIRRIRPLPDVPESMDDDNEHDTIDLRPPSPSRLRAKSQRTTLTSVWSQDTGYTLSQSVDAEGQEARRRLAISLLVPDDRAEVGGMTQRRSTPSGPRPPPGPGTPRARSSRALDDEHSTLAV